MLSIKLASLLFSWGTIALAAAASSLRAAASSTRSEMSVKIEKIVEPLYLGEGPHWDSRVQALYFVSVYEKTIHKYVPATKTHTRTSIDGRPGFIVPLDGHLDQFLVGLERRFVVVQWDGSEGGSARVVRVVGEVDRHTPNNRINDGKADPRGRVFAGTMADPFAGDEEKEKGAVFRVDGDGISQVDSKISIANGLAWDLATGTFYYIDSFERKVRKYDYDVETGKISNMRYHFDLEKAGLTGLPDGTTIDSAGNLWVALFDGGVVAQVSPGGQLLRTVEIPAKQVTSCTFGGPNLDILFVTTARFLYSKDFVAKPGDGCTYTVTGLGVKGLENVNCKI